MRSWCVSLHVNTSLARAGDEARAVHTTDAVFILRVHGKWLSMTSQTAEGRGQI